MGRDEAGEMGRQMTVSLMKRSLHIKSRSNIHFSSAS
jgi:hypothetical protein